MISSPPAWQHGEGSDPNALLLKSTAGFLSKIQDGFFFLSELISDSWSDDYGIVLHWWINILLQGRYLLGKISYTG